VQRVDRVQQGGLAGGIETEEEPYEARKGLAIFEEIPIRYTKPDFPHVWRSHTGPTRIR